MRLKFSILCCLGAIVWRAIPAEQTAVVTEQKINVRGQPSLVGEVVTQLQKGDTVTVLDEVNVEKPKPGEPTNWAKIKLPANTPVWVFSSLIKDGVVTASRLNMRAGPGENYSVLGRLERGDKVKPIRSVEEWTEIEAPENAYAFVDASLIRKSGQTGSPAPETAAPAVAARTAPARPPAAQAENPSSAPGAQSQSVAKPEKLQVSTDTRAVPSESSAKPGSNGLQAPVTTPQPAAPPPTVLPAPGSSASITPPQPASAAPALPAALPEVAAVPPAKQPETVNTRRVVRREGIIRATKSIQAPTWYELVHPETKKTIDFLHEEKLGIKLKEYKGQKVVVTGEEAVDPRWPNTPILEMETLDIAP